MHVRLCGVARVAALGEALTSGDRVANRHLDRPGAQMDQGHVARAVRDFDNDMVARNGRHPGP